MKKYYIEAKDLTNNFVFCYNNPSINGKSVWQVYSINKKVDEYFKFCHTYIDVNDYINFGKGDLNNTHVSNIHLPDSLKDNKTMEFRENRELIFHFPDDYPEEDLFYFCLKFNAKNLDNL